MATESDAQKRVIYDANSIIYYCFMHEEKIKGKTVSIRVMGLTKKIQSLTEQFVAEGFEIVTISGVIEEIFDKGIAKIVDEFCEDHYTRELMGLSKKTKISSSIRLRLARKTEGKIRRLQDKAWFHVIDYHPDERRIHRVKTFYTARIGTPKMEEHLKKKRTKVPYPSDVDMALLLYSKETKAPIVTHDSDLIDFKEELEEEGLCFGIIVLDP
jgi:hypothetical protein